MTIFEQAFAIVVGVEGGLSLNPADPGNWTGGAQGRGTCRGTKYGISASAHPECDIATLTLADAQAIYRAAYWNAVEADALPPALALLVFDASINNGPARAIRWLQAAVRVPVDGVIGPITIAASQHDTSAVCAEFQAHRLLWMTHLPTWSAFGLGWSRRICSLPFHALTLVQA